MRERNANLTRRDFIEAAAACALAAMPGRALAQTGPDGRLGDAHVHLFNLSDIPARGFFEHAVLWNTALDFWLVRPLWPAMLDMIVFLKSKTPTAEAELATYEFNPKAPEDIDKKKFTEMSNRRIANMARQSRIYTGPHRVAPAAPLSRRQLQLRDSYYRLAAVLGLVGHPPWRPAPGEAPECHLLEDGDIARIREGAGFLHEDSCREAPHEASNMGAFETVDRTLQWGRALMQSRQHHLRTYRDRVRDSDFSPGTIVNLLVDYDEWLGDGPAEASNTDAQIALWQRMRADYMRTDYAPQIDIRTFAGFDPLKQGLEGRGCFRGEPRPETTFARNRAHFLGGAIHGFKLYPPMGFRPIGNSADMFRGRRRALRIVHERLEQCELTAEDLPGLLDDALNELYDFCEQHSAPIVAHAYHSNESALCAGAFAGPSGWEAVVAQRRRLRICLAHFAEGRGFVAAMRRHGQGRPVALRHWPFHGTERLLLNNARGECQVFVDLSYMAEFLHEGEGERRAADFFRALKDYCGRYDPECRYFLFGTDWIMLERESRNQQYLERIRKAMSAAGWTDAWQRNLLQNNLQRFLGNPFVR